MYYLIIDCKNGLSGVHKGIQGVATYGLQTSTTMNDIPEGKHAMQHSLMRRYSGNVALQLENASSKNNVIDAAHKC